MGLFDTIECDYPLADSRHQNLEFQTKDLDCLLERYSITKDGRLIKHPRRGLSEEGLVVETDVELPMHGDLLMYDQDPEARGLVEYAVRFTHGRVEWIRRKEGSDGSLSKKPRPNGTPGVARTAGQVIPDSMGRPITAEEFVSHVPEKLELVDGRIPGDKKLLLVILTSLGLRRAAALLGYDVWKKGLP